MKRIREYGIIIGNGTPGKRNKISDLSGVTVGHTTLINGDVQTGVTTIRPHQGNLFKEKVVASCHVINGFGKTQGLSQIMELGTMETPILLTNTLNIGIVCDGLIEYMLEENPEIGVTTGTVNPVVGECNDGYLNDIRGRHVKKDHVFQALERTTEDFREGAAGAGRGMSAYGLKGGIGSASRVLELQDHLFTVGALVLSNFGKLENFTLEGINIGKWIAEKQKRSEKDLEPAINGNDKGHQSEHSGESDHERERKSSKEETTEDKGSVIIVLATDAPLSDRQLNRMCRRAVVGLSRTGTEIGHGSGDFVIAFSTANPVPHESVSVTRDTEQLAEDKMDSFFNAAIEAVEESVLNSMVTAETTTGRSGHQRISLSEYLKEAGSEGFLYRTAKEVSKLR